MDHSPRFFLLTVCYSQATCWQAGEGVASRMISSIGASECRGAPEQGRQVSCSFRVIWIENVNWNLPI